VAGANVQLCAVRGGITIRFRIYPWLVGLAALAVVTIVVPLTLGLGFISRRAAGIYPRQISATASFAWHALLLTVGLGIVAMAVVECIKRLIPVRGLFHNRELRSYLGRTSFVMMLEQMPVRGDRLSWLDAPAEQVFAQIGAFADRAFVKVVEPELDKTQDPRHDRNYIWRLFLNSLIHSESDGNRPLSVQLGPDLSAEELRSQVDSALDRLQVMIAARWRRILRLTSCVMAALLALVVVLYSPAGFGVALLTVAAAFTVGGFFSWFARDVAAGVERWRR